MATITPGKCTAPSDLGINYIDSKSITTCTRTCTCDMPTEFYSADYYTINTTGTSDCSCFCSSTDLHLHNILYDEINKRINRSNEFKTIIEYVPNKVYSFIFNDEEEIKTICDEEDEFNLEFAFYLALAKKIYGKTYTLKGVMKKAEELSTLKEYEKVVKKGMKLFTKQQEEKIKARKEEEAKKAQHKRYIEKKIKQKERKRQEQINIIAEAIKKSKEEG